MYGGKNMKKRIIIGAFAVLAAIGLVFAFSACEITISLSELKSFQASGRVVNASTGEGVESATVTLAFVEGSDVETETLEEEEPEGEKEAPDDVENYQADNTTYTATTGADGTFAFDASVEDILTGEYTMTVAKDGFVFVPPGNITILGGSQDLGSYMAFPYDAATEEYYVKLILVWSQDFADVDGHLTYPKNGESVGAGMTTFEPYTIPEPTNVLEGFSPETVSTLSKRETIKHDNKTSTLTVTGGTAYRVSLDVDNRGRDTDPAGGPETITIREVPFNDQVTTNEFPRADAGLGSNYDATIEWNGVMEYYVRAYAHTTDADGVAASGAVAESYLAEVGTGQSADAKLYVFQGETILGAYTLPKFTDIKNASLLRIHCFEDTAGSWFQLWPHTTLVTETEYTDNGYRFRSLNNNGVITTKKMSR
jgi:hypothetical protein